MAKRNKPPKTWRYSHDFKSRAVEMSYLDGIQIQQVAEGLGIHPFMKHDRPGFCIDNGHMESFFYSLKAELISWQDIQK